MSQFTNAFKTDSVDRSSGQSEDGCGNNNCNQCTPACPPKCEPEPIPFPQINKIVKSVEKACHPETGKWWLTQTCMVYDESCGKWEESCEGIYELPAKYFAGDTMPSFNGVQKAYTATEAIQVVGGQELPADMVGFFLCLEGEVCYVGNPPAQEIPDEVWCGAEAPTDPNVEIWTYGGITKTKNAQGLWVQTTPFGD